MNLKSKLKRELEIEVHITIPGSLFNIGRAKPLEKRVCYATVEHADTTVESHSPWTSSMLSICQLTGPYSDLDPVGIHQLKPIPDSGLMVASDFHDRWSVIRGRPSGALACWSFMQRRYARLFRKGHNHDAFSLRAITIICYANIQMQAN